MFLVDVFVVKVWFFGTVLETYFLIGNLVNVSLLLLDRLDLDIPDMTALDGLTDRMCHVAFHHEQ